MIGVAGFEPATSWSQTRRSTKLSYTPHCYGDDRNRTCDILLAKQTLYQLSYIPESGGGVGNRTRVSQIFQSTMYMLRSFSPRILAMNNRWIQVFGVNALPRRAWLNPH